MLQLSDFVKQGKRSQQPRPQMPPPSAGGSGLSRPGLGSSGRLGAIGETKLIPWQELARIVQGG